MNYIVKDLMVPISEYATVPVGATLFEAVLALEEAQLNFDRSKYQHRDGKFFLSAFRQRIMRQSQDIRQTDQRNRAAVQ